MKNILATIIVGLSSMAASADTITEIASKGKDFTILTKALKATGLDKALDGDGQFTVFAPTDDAFKKLPKGTLAALLKPEAKEKLAAILKYHVVPAKVDSATAVGLTEAATLNGEKIRVSFKKARLFMNDAKVVDADIAADNGVIHVLDYVLLPTESSLDGKSLAAKKMLLEAIDSGVDLFNSGNTKACEAIYLVAVRGVVAIEPEALGEKQLSSLKQALKAADARDNSRDDSWILRRAMDEALQVLAN